MTPWLAPDGGSALSYTGGGRRSGSGLCWGATCRGIAARKLTAMGRGSVADRLPVLAGRLLAPHRSRFSHSLKTHGCHRALIAGTATGAVDRAGDWASSGPPGKIDLADVVGTEQDIEEAVAPGRLEGDVLAVEGLADEPGAAGKGDAAIDLNPPDRQARRVLDGRQPFWEWSVGGSKAIGRWHMAEGLMGPTMVVEPPPAIEVGLDGGELDIATVGDQLGLERSVETLVLALCLRVIGPAMDRTDAEPHQPSRQPGVAMLAVRPPGRAVVHQHAFRQAIGSEGGLQRRLHAVPPLVGKGRQHHGIARVIVHHRQRMTPQAGQREMPLEVHLPQPVRRVVLKPLERPMSRRLGRVDQTVPPQDARHGVGMRRRDDTLELQKVMDLRPPHR